MLLTFGGTAGILQPLPALPPHHHTCRNTPMRPVIKDMLLPALRTPPDAARLGDPLRMRLLAPAAPRRTVITGARRPPLSSDCAGPERAGAGLRAPVSMLAVAPAQSVAMLCMQALAFDDAVPIAISAHICNRGAYK